MELTPDKWEKVKVLFEAAVEQSPETRATFLLRDCPEDDIRGEVERLLRLDAQRGHFLSGPAFEQPAFCPRKKPQPKSACPAMSLPADSG